MSHVRTTALVLALCCASGAGSRPEAQAPQTIAAALGALQSGDAAGAVSLLEAIVSREPGNGRAWRALGQAHLAAKSLEAADKAFHRALEVEPGMPMPLYNLGVVAALAGRTDEAFAWLGKARDTGKIDMTLIDVAPPLRSLATDPRFAALRPDPKTFEHPFVEDVRVLAEWRGEAAGDQFGWIARNLGDVDGDGIADVVTSAPSHASAGENAGRVYVYSSRSGQRLWHVDGKPGDQLGLGVEAAGDTNGDGVPDVIASAPGSERAFIYSGRDGRLLQTLHGETEKEGFGSHTAGVGDLDGDRCADVIVGAPSGQSHGVATGRAYVFSGKDGRVLATLTGENDGDSFGAAVTGDVHGHARLVVVGAGKGGPRHAGKVYVYRDVRKPAAFTFEADATGNALGAMFVSVPGDVDGDGAADVFASDWSNAARGDQAGRTYVLSGKTGRVIFTFDGETAGEGFGTSASVAGDVDRDGHADLIVGAWQYGGAAIGGGRAYLYSGRDGRLMRTYTCRTPGDTFGFDAVTLGDVDRDGQDDFVITSGWSGVSGNHSGRVFIVSSGVVPKKR
ncbi:MAG: FG-GAP-like repeat-containing protein [Vicinamibacterales bacterium]